MSFLPLGTKAITHLEINIVSSRNVPNSYRHLPDRQTGLEVLPN